MKNIDIFMKSNRFKTVGHVCYLIKAIKVNIQGKYELHADLPRYCVPRSRVPAQCRVTQTGLAG